MYGLVSYSEVKGYAVAIILPCLVQRSPHGDDIEGQYRILIGPILQIDRALRPCDGACQLLTIHLKRVCYFYRSVWTVGVPGPVPGGICTYGETNGETKGKQCGKDCFIFHFNSYCLQTIKLRGLLLFVIDKERFKSTSNRCQLVISRTYPFGAALAAIKKAVALNARAPNILVS